jgi:hypothetical protein
MHPIILRDRAKAWITDPHRQAKKNTPLTPAHTIAELTHHALTLPGARGPGQHPTAGASTKRPPA